MARDTKKIDKKGRFFIPTKQKEMLGSELVVTNSLDAGYLCVYRKDHFDSVIKPQLEALNSLDPKVRRLKRAIIGEREEVTLDSQGRINVSQELWDKIGAHPEDDICLFDDDYKLDICTKASYEQEDHDISNIVGLEILGSITGL